ncbi:hypothetical protein KKC59_01995, partial [bacterium]|nr:hypothetical protein [bacterium]
SFLVCLVLLYIFLLLPVTFFKGNAKQLNTIKNFSIDKALEGLPKTWLITKDQGLSVFDNSDTSISNFENTIISMDLTQTTPDPEQLKTKRILITKNFIYLKSPNEITHRQIDLNEILKNKNSLKLTLIKNPDLSFKNLSIVTDNSLLKEITKKDFKKYVSIAGIFVGIILLILFIIGFIIWKLFLALILSLLLTLTALIGKKDLEFSKVFLIAILIQSWYLVLNMLSLPRYAPTLLVVAFGCFVILKFIESDKSAVQDDRE